MLGVLFTRQGPVHSSERWVPTIPTCARSSSARNWSASPSHAMSCGSNRSASADHETIVAAVGPTMQRYLAGDLGLAAGG